jgi:competence protein ComEA
MTLQKFAILSTLTAAFAAGQQREVPGFPEGPGKDTFERVCSLCHSPTHVLTKEYNKAEWTEMVVGMLVGEEVSKPDQEAIINYLTAGYPKKVNINKAPAADLEKILEIGPAEAQAIVAYRTANGAFKTASDLEKIPGWNSAKIEAIRKRIQF